VGKLTTDESQTKGHALLEIIGLQDNQLPIKKAIFDYLQEYMENQNHWFYHGSISDASIGIPKIPWEERAKRRVIRYLEKPSRDQDGNL
jgi:hypothetical protein